MSPGKKRALAPLLRDPRYELLPLQGIEEHVGALPSGATVTVTCSPSKGQDRTVEVAERLAALGLRVVPHIAARQVRDDVHLKEVVDRLDRAGITDVFVVGGDPTDETGPYATGLELLAALSEQDHPFSRIGIPGYPEGHYLVDDETLTAALLAKQPYATYLVTQLCFDARTICRWLAEMRQRGVRLPCYVGVPGTVDLHKLFSISMRIGIGDSMRFLRGNRATVRRLLRAGGYKPDGLVRRLGTLVRDGQCDIDGFHIYTFNQIEPTVRWVEQARDRADPSAGSTGFGRSRMIRRGAARTTERTETADDLSG